MHILVLLCVLPQIVIFVNADRFDMNNYPGFLYSDAAYFDIKYLEQEQYNHGKGAYRDSSGHSTPKSFQQSEKLRRFVRSGNRHHPSCSQVSSMFFPMHSAVH